MQKKAQNKECCNAGSSKIRPDLILKGISSLLTMRGSSNDDVSELKNVSMAVKDGLIAYIGGEADFDANVEEGSCELINCENKVVLPSFVDCHTHSVFGGSRVTEYALKLSPKGREELKKSGIKTGIYASVEMTEKESEDELFEKTLAKVLRMMETGTTTLEIKSGYGLDRDTEIKQLKVIKRLKKALPINIVATYLGAHSFPERGDRAEYLNFMIDEMLPYIAKNELADAVDIWIEDSYFVIEEARRLMDAARLYGFKLKAHTNEFSDIGGPSLACELGFLSVDHMNYVGDDEILKLKEAGIVAVILAGTDFSVRHPKPADGRRMLDLGLDIAIATNLNPSNYFTSMQSIISLACNNNGFGVEEAIRAATYGGAKALGMQDRVGVLSEAYSADFMIWDTENYRDVCYKHDTNLCERVYCGGKLVAQNTTCAPCNKSL